MAQQLLQISREIPIAVEAARVNQGDGTTGHLDVGARRRAQEVNEVDAVLGSRAIIPGEELQRQQVAHPGTMAASSPPLGTRRAVASRPAASCSTSA